MHWISSSLILLSGDARQVAGALRLSLGLSAAISIVAGIVLFASLGRSNAARLPKLTVVLTFLLGAGLTARAAPWDPGLYAGCTLLLVTVLILTRITCSPRYLKVIASMALLSVALTGLVRGLTWSIAGTERVAVLYAMHARPLDPWPRSSGHVPLGAFGAAEFDKGYMEPGGSFSPAFGSFGVSFWVVERGGKLVTTSDSIPLASTRQSYIGTSGLPAIEAESDLYSVRWTVEPSRRVRLEALSRTPPGQHLEVAIRGVGPAGGALRDIRAERGRLVLNERWVIELPPTAQLTYIGEEGARGWTHSAVETISLPSSVHSTSGWAHVRFAVPGESSVSLQIADSPVPEPSTVTDPRLPAGEPPSLASFPTDVQGASFAASLRAQTTSLLLGLVDTQTRPGEPINYPLSWQRDGAYVLVALARAGHHKLAKALAGQFARDDFFGGYGAEADAPGLSLWALFEVSEALGDPQFVQSLWPHIARKAGIVLQLMSAQTQVHYAYKGPLVPGLPVDADPTLVADANRGGLIDGRMDWTRPVFYVNAVSYAGLERAALIARRLGHQREGDLWASQATRLQTSWRALFARVGINSPQARDDHSAIIGLWPTEVAESASYAALLESRRSRLWDPAGYEFKPRPLWTYFTVAEAHQWLRLGRPDRVWETLTWFWHNQPAPGLYTQWEGKTEENGFGLWARARGWVQPPNVTPHYWSAAEMLLLQLEMLAYVEDEVGAPELVIGAGVPSSWLAAPIAVSGIGTAKGVVDWRWTPPGSVTVRLLQGDRLPVRLGPSFPKSTVIRLEVVAGGS